MRHGLCDRNCRVLTPLELMLALLGVAAFVQHGLHGSCVLCLEGTLKPRLPCHRRRPAPVPIRVEVRLLPADGKLTGINILKRVHAVVGDPAGWGCSVRRVAIPREPFAAASLAAPAAAAGRKQQLRLGAAVEPAQHLQHKAAVVGCGQAELIFSRGQSVVQAPRVLAPRRHRPKRCGTAEAARLAVRRNGVLSLAAARHPFRPRPVLLLCRGLQEVLSDVDSVIDLLGVVLRTPRALSDPVTVYVE